MWAWQFMKMLGIQRAHGLAPFVSMQNYLNLVYREEEREMLPLCRAEGIAVTPWSPLARGFLAGSKRRGATVRARTDTSRTRWGWVPSRTSRSSSGCRRWRTAGGQAGAGGAGLGAGTPGVSSPIVGASKPHHLADALGALELTLDAETRNPVGLLQIGPRLGVEPQLERASASAR